MSIELTRARQNLNSISSLLKRDKILPAASALHDGLVTFVKGKLLKSEKQEFSNLLERNLSLLNNHPGIRQVYPVLLILEPGKEKDLLENLRQLMSVLESEMSENALESLQELDRKKKQALSEAQALLSKKEMDAADQIFKRLIRDFQEDFELKIEIVDLLLEAEQYLKAIDYLKHAYRDNPGSVHVYNRLGMALRKLGRFPESEKAFSQAVKIQPRDEYLHFNLGRLYLDMQDWHKAMHSAQKALSINPDFEQARKMLKFALNKTKS